jgi:hypothetical protein
MNVKAEFLKSVIVSGECVNAGTKRPVRADIFAYLKSIRAVREDVSQADQVAVAPAQAQPEPAKKKGKN